MDWTLLFSQNSIWFRKSSKPWVMKLLIDWIENRKRRRSLRKYDFFVILCIDWFIYDRFLFENKDLLLIFLLFSLFPSMKRLLFLKFIFTFNCSINSRTVSMRYYHKFAIAGCLISLIPVILGFIALTTRVWIRIGANETSPAITYGLFHRCQRMNNNSGDESFKCVKLPSFLLVQSLIVTSFVLFILSLSTGVAYTAFCNRRSLHIYPPISLYASTLYCIFSLCYYIKFIVELHPEVFIVGFKLGYSLILMFIGVSVGIGLMGYFSFTAGYIYHQI